MKKLFIISFVLLLSAKSYSQTQFPFYGFELSNYEVGDTLEYQYNYLSVGGETDRTTVYTFIKKELLNSNSVKFTLQEALKESDFTFGGGSSFSKADTIISVITNDTVYNNSNNILGILLYRFDTSTARTLCQQCPFDSAYLNFDTVGNLKRLHLNIQQSASSSEYLLIQNIGIVQSGYAVMDLSIGYNLIYAHLSHYGIYGTYNPIILGIDNPSVLSSSVSIRYDNDMNTWLHISSTHNLKPVLTLYSLTGQKVELQSITTGNNLIDMRALSKGMYLYRVESQGNVLGHGKLMNL